MTRLFATWRFARSVYRAGRAAWKSRAGDDCQFWREQADFWIGSAASWARESISK